MKLSFSIKGWNCRDFDEYINTLMSGGFDSSGSYYDGSEYKSYFSKKIVESYHGTGDIFSSVIVGNIMNGVSVEETLKDAVEFIIDCILNTIDDKSHFYGVKFEELLKRR